MREKSDALCICIAMTIFCCLFDAFVYLSEYFDKHVWHIACAYVVKYDVCDSCVQST